MHSPYRHCEPRSGVAIQKGEKSPVPFSRLDCHAAARLVMTAYLNN
jgi:hypothetical protein